MEEPQPVDVVDDVFYLQRRRRSSHRRRRLAAISSSTAPVRTNLSMCLCVCVAMGAQELLLVLLLLTQPLSAAEAGCGSSGQPLFAPSTHPTKRRQHTPVATLDKLRVTDTFGTHRKRETARATKPI